MGTFFRYYDAATNDVHTRVGVFIDGKLSGTLVFDTPDYHDQWDKLADLVIATPTPPGLEVSND